MCTPLLGSAKGGGVGARGSSMIWQSPFFILLVSQKLVMFEDDTPTPLYDNFDTTFSEEGKKCVKSQPAPPPPFPLPLPLLFPHGKKCLLHFQLSVFYNINNWP